MVDKIFQRQFDRAMAEGRKCERCGWMITKKRWKLGRRLCAGCQDALKGVNKNGIWGTWLDEETEKTGEMP